MKPHLIIALVAACGANDLRSDVERLKSPQDGFSVAKPDDTWTSSRDRGSLMFTGSDKRAKHTIVIRSVPRPAQLAERTPSTFDNVVAATKKALASLPGVELEGSHRVERSELPAVDFALTFKPAAGGGKRYQRHDAVVLGATHILQVIYTAPEGEPIDDELFQTMVSTIREEG